jgi:hypothetical protein
MGLASPPSTALRFVEVVGTGNYSIAHIFNMRCTLPLEHSLYQDLGVQRRLRNGLEDTLGIQPLVDQTGSHKDTRETAQTPASG